MKSSKTKSMDIKNCPPDLDTTVSFDEILNLHEEEAIYLDVVFDDAIVGISTYGSILYDYFRTISLYMEWNKSAEKEFDSWEDFYDYCEEMVLGMTSYRDADPASPQYVYLKQSCTVKAESVSAGSFVKTSGTLKKL